MQVIFGDYWPSLDTCILGQRTYVLALMSAQYREDKRFHIGGVGM